jgi:hypothetical protein
MEIQLYCIAAILVRDIKTKEGMESEREEEGGRSECVREKAPRQGWRQRAPALGLALTPLETTWNVQDKAPRAVQGRSPRTL